MEEGLFRVRRMQRHRVQGRSLEAASVDEEEKGATVCFQWPHTSQASSVKVPGAEDPAAVFQAILVAEFCPNIASFGSSTSLL